MLDTGTIVDLARTWYGLELSAEAANRISAELATLAAGIRPMVEELSLDDRPARLGPLLLKHRAR